MIFLLAASGVKAEKSASIIRPTPLSYKTDWRWVEGAVFVPTKNVNEAQQRDEYDPVNNDRVLHYASIYGIKSEFVFFNDCWNRPDADILSLNYKYHGPIPGAHNSRWLQFSTRPDSGCGAAADAVIVFRQWSLPSRMGKPPDCFSADDAYE